MIIWKGVLPGHLIFTESAYVAKTTVGLTHIQPQDGPQTHCPRRKVNTTGAEIH